MVQNILIDNIIASTITINNTNLIEDTNYIVKSIDIDKANSSDTNVLAVVNKTGDTLNGVSNNANIFEIAIKTDSDFQINTLGTFDISFTTPNNRLIIQDTGEIQFNPDEDKTTTIGKTRMGYDGTNSDAFVISHYDHLNTSTYSLKLSSTETTWNSVTNNTIKIGGTAIYTTSATEVTCNVPYTLSSYTTSERNDLTGISNMIIYNSTDSSLQFYNGTDWISASVPISFGGTQNTFAGFECADNASGQDNSFLGYRAGKGSASFSGSYNTIVGADAGGITMTTASNNTFIGYKCAYLTVDQSNNTAVGNYALYNGGGDGNTAIGHYALYSLETGIECTAVGNYAGYDLTSSYATTIGHEAGRGATTSQYLTAYGYRAYYTDTSITSASTGDYNTAVGYESMGSGSSQKTGNYNSAIGYQSLYNITSGSYNTVLGYQAGVNITTGSYNTIAGHTAGITLTTGSYNTIIGPQADVSDADAQHRIAIGYEANATIDYGLFVITGLAVVSSTAVLYDSDTGAFGPTSSSRTTKKNIQPISDSIQRKINKLTPKEFDYINNGIHSIGFIAEEVKKILPIVVPVDKQNQCKGMHYDLLIPILQNGMKKRLQLLKDLEEQINNL